MDDVIGTLKVELLGEASKLNNTLKEVEEIFGITIHTADTGGARIEASSESARAATASLQKYNEELKRSVEAAGQPAGTARLLKGRDEGADAEIMARTQALLIEKEATDNLVRSQRALDQQKRRLIASLERELTTQGMSTRQKQLAELVDKGLADSDLKRARSAVNTLDHLDRQNAELERAKKTFASLTPPVDRYTEKLGQLDTLLKRGTITKEQYATATTRLSEAFQRGGANLEYWARQAAITVDSMTAHGNLSQNVNLLAGVTRAYGAAVGSVIGPTGALGSSVGFLGTSISGLIGASAASTLGIAALALGAVGVTVAVMDWAESQIRLNHELERSVHLQKELERATTRQTKESLRGVELAPTKEESRGLLNPLVAVAEKDVSSVRKKISVAEEELLKLKLEWTKILDMPLAEATETLATREARKSVLTTQIANDRAQLEELQKRLDSFRSRQKELSPETESAKATRGLNELNKEMERNNALIGQSAEMKRIAKAAEEGADPVAVARSKELEREKVLLEDASRAQKEYERQKDSFLETLTREVKTYGMSHRAKQLSELADKGLAGEELKRAKAQVAALESLDKQTKEINKAKSLFESLKGPTERYKDQMEELNLLMRKEIITPQQYSEATQKLADNFNKVENKATRAAHSVRRFDAALLNSAEGFSRIQEFQDSLLLDNVRSHGRINRPVQVPEARNANAIGEGDVIVDVQNQSKEILKSIAENTKKALDKPSVTLEAASLA